MSDVSLPTRYAPENYRPALDNLAQRYQKSGDQPVHYSEAAFDGISEDQAQSSLRFFGEIGLLEIPTQGKYVPSDELVAWLRQMGPSKEEKAAVRETLMDYEVFDETIFLLDKGGVELDDLVSQVGSLVGIDKDEAGHLKKALQIFDDLEFIEIGDDGTVTLPSEVELDTSDEGVTPPAGSKDGEESYGEPDAKSSDGGSSASKEGPPTTSGFQAQFELVLDASDMAPDELDEKLGIIRKYLGHDAE